MATRSRPAALTVAVVGITLVLISACSPALNWREVRPEQAAWPWQARRRLAQMWERIWVQPAGERQAAEATSEAAPATSASK